MCDNCPYQNLPEESLYILSDGRECFGIKSMTPEKLEQAQKDAEIHTDGNLWWIKADIVKEFARNPRGVIKMTENEYGK